MIRLLGGMVGSALAIALLLLLVGIPQFRAPATTAEPTIVTLPLRTSPVDPPERYADRDAMPHDPLEDDAGDRTVALAEPAPDRLAGGATTEPGPAAAAAPVAALEGTELATGVVADAGSALDETGWYPFWSPFRSEIAAAGFVTRLSSVTGLDYRIDRMESGVYQVAFAYRDEDEIADNLSRITAATGLELASR